MKIEVTEEQYKAFQNGESITLVPPKKKYEIKYDKGESFFVDRCGTMDDMAGNDKDCLTHGRYRKTKENAEYSRKENQERNLLEALVEDLQGELGVGDYIVGKIGGVYKLDLTVHVDCTGLITKMVNVGDVVMKQKTARKVCELLNSGQYKLEP